MSGVLSRRLGIARPLNSASMAVDLHREQEGTRSAFEEVVSRPSVLHGRMHIEFHGGWEPGAGVSTPPSPAKKVDPEVHNDADEPGTQWRGWIPAAFCEAHEGLLDDVVCVGRRAREAVGNTPQIALVRPEGQVDGLAPRIVRHHCGEKKRLRVEGATVLL